MIAGLLVCKVIAFSCLYTIVLMQISYVHGSVMYIPQVPLDICRLTALLQTQAVVPFRYEQWAWSTQSSSTLQFKAVWPVCIPVKSGSLQSSMLIINVSLDISEHWQRNNTFGSLGLSTHMYRSLPVITFFHQLFNF